MKERNKEKKRRKGKVNNNKETEQLYHNKDERKRRNNIDCVRQFQYEVLGPDLLAAAIMRSAEQRIHVCGVMLTADQLRDNLTSTHNWIKI